MADATLSTKFSRRTILAGTAAALPVLSVLPVTPEFDPDAGLLRRVAAVGRLKAAYAGAEAERLRLSEVKFNHPEHPGLLVTKAAHDKYREISEQVGYGPARRLCGRLFRRYAAATRAAIRTPARTPRGLHAKLALCLDAAWKGELRIYMFEDKEWLEYALADLERLAMFGGDAGFSRRPPPNPPPRAGEGFFL